MFRASLETRNFCFEAYSETKNGAVLALTEGLRAHGQQYRLRANWFAPDEIYTREIQINLPYRDEEKIKC